MGDAEAHLNIARRIFDSRLPGYEQIGTVWLPVPHVLMMALARIDSLWHNGLAGAIPAALCFVLGGWWLCQAARRLFNSDAAAAAATAVYALNPNLLYLQSTPMTEPMALCFFCGLIYALACFHANPSRRAAVAAGFLLALGTLTRYEFWALIPFAALVVLFNGGERRWSRAFLFGLVASAGPLYWLAHNAVMYSNALEFYNGPYSAKAIYARQRAAGMSAYPGEHNWTLAWLYYRTAVELALGQPLLWMGAAGAVLALLKKARWAVLLAAFLAGFYVLSLYSSGTPIFVPKLWPNSYYNTRYALAALPLLALGVAGLVSLGPGRTKGLLAIVAVIAAVAPWVGYPSRDTWVCWKESQLNSVDRRAWTSEAAAYLKAHYRPGAGILTSFGDLTGVLREAGIPIHESLHEGDLALWDGAVARPDLLLHEEWVLAHATDRAGGAVRKLRSGPRRYQCVRIYEMKGSPAVEIWRHIQ
jgi:4-amino-4-deoxy-L-arabinose transferase-like glycosyltransferase